MFVFSNGSVGRRNTRGDPGYGRPARYVVKRVYATRFTSLFFVAQCATHPMRPGPPTTRSSTVPHHTAAALCPCRHPTAPNWMTTPPALSLLLVCQPKTTAAAASPTRWFGHCRHVEPERVQLTPPGSLQHLPPRMTTKTSASGIYTTAGAYGTRDMCIYRIYYL